MIYIVNKIKFFLMKENLFLDLFVVFFKSRIDIIWINKYNFCIIWLEKNSIV